MTNKSSGGLLGLVIVATGLLVGTCYGKDIGNAIEGAVMDNVGNYFNNSRIEYFWNSLDNSQKESVINKLRDYLNQ